MQYSFGTVGHRGDHHVVKGRWYAGAPPLCSPHKHTTREIKNPDPDKTCAACLRIMAVPGDAASVRFLPPVAGRTAVPDEDTHDRRFTMITRRQCFVVHPHQREVKTPPWPARWGEFSLQIFYQSLEPVTVISAELVRGLNEYQCPEHGADCPYTAWPEAEYVVLGGQHRTLEGGRVLGPDWEFQAAELTTPIGLPDLSRSWWITEQRRTAGSREIFAKKVQDGDPDYVAMAACLHGNGYGYTRGQAAGGLQDFTSIGTLPQLWLRDPQAVEIMLRTLAEVRSAVKDETRMPLVRAVFEIAHWDLTGNTGPHVLWARKHGIAGKLARLGGKLRQAEQEIGLPGKSAWQRVAAKIAQDYNRSRTRDENRVNFPATWK